MKRRTSRPASSLHRQIVDVLTRQRKPISLARLASLLHVDEDDETFLQAMDRLRREGIIYAERGDRYGSAAGLGALIGRLSVTERGFGFVKPEEGGEDIHIPEKRMGDAIDGDRVLVVPLRRHIRGRRTGHVLGVVERPERLIVGTFHRGPGFAWIHPSRRTLPDIQLLGPIPPDLPDGHRIVARLEPVTLLSSIPLATIERVIGSPLDPWVDIEGIIYEFGLREHFPSEVEREASRLPEGLDARVLDGRRDLRAWEVVTIDPADAADIDDAISLTRDENGRRVVGIHIADVAHYVAMGGEIDREAAARGTSVYLPGRVLHMLPRRLSQKLCSLLPDEDRPAVSVLITLNAKGNPAGVEIVRSVIRSRAQLSYEQVQAVLDGQRDEDNPACAHAEMLAELAKIAMRLNRQRTEAGALDFDVPEVEVKVDEQGHVASLRVRERLMSHRLIEELMLLANRTVARHLARHKFDLLYRVHAGPDPAKLGEVATLAAAIGHPISTDGRPMTVEQLQSLLRAVEGKPIAPVLETLIIRSLPKAVYQPENIGHFGLATDEYTHFTSPIRRYPDLIVHRQLIRLLEGKPPAYTREQLEEIGRQSSEAEQKAEAAEREAIRAKQVEFLAAHVGERFAGTISGVQRFGLFVMLNDSLAEGLIPIEELPEDIYRFDPAHMSLTGRHHRNTYRFGDPVIVQVARADTEARQVEFILVDAPQARRRAREAPSPEEKGASARPSHRTRRPSRRYHRVKRRRR